MAYCVNCFRPFVVLWRCAFFFFFFFDKSKKGDYALDSAIGLTRGTIAKWRSGRSYPSLTAAVKVSKYLNMSIDEMLGIVPPSATTLQRLDSDNERNELMNLFAKNAKNHPIFGGHAPERMQQLQMDIQSLFRSPDLQRIIDAWPRLTEAQRMAFNMQMTAFEQNMVGARPPKKKAEAT